MAKIDNKDPTAAQYGLQNFTGPWVPGRNYYRLDGKTSKQTRHTMINRFNDPQNTQVSAFLISARAGGMGINLTGANRVIILDTSWNPSNDQQNIFRVFRLGQKRNCYVYRLLAMGTMEEKVYSRSVTKQALSYRVVDEQQIDRHYNMAELEELYVLSMPDFNERPVPIRPTDRLLANLVHNFPNIIFKYHVHDSLLENKPEEHLSEADKREAWAEYEQQEKRHEQPPAMNPLMNFDEYRNLLAAQLSNYRQTGAVGGGVGGLGPASYLPLMTPPYSSGLAVTDPYLQMLHALDSGNPAMPGMSGYGGLVSGMNRYFTSGSLFPPEPAIAGPSGLMSGVSSPGGIGGDSAPAGGVAGKKRQNKDQQQQMAGMKRAMNWAALSHQMAGFDPSYMWNMSGGVGAGGLSLPGDVQPGGSKNSNAQSRPGVVRIPTPPPFTPISSPLPPVIPPQQLYREQQKKRPRILSKAGSSQAAAAAAASAPTPVALPPSTTIEKLPLGATQLPTNIKSPILPSVPQSITVEKVTAPVVGVGQKGVNRTQQRIVPVGKPTAVINLIDDVIGANPGLSVHPINKKTVRPIKLPVNTARATTGGAQGDRVSQSPNSAQAGSANGGAVDRTTSNNSQQVHKAVNRPASKVGSPAVTVTPTANTTLKDPLAITPPRTTIQEAKPKQQAPPQQLQRSASNLKPQSGGAKGGVIKASPAGAAQSSVPTSTSPVQKRRQVPLPIATVASQLVPNQTGLRIASVTSLAPVNSPPAAKSVAGGSGTAQKVAKNVPVTATGSGNVGIIRNPKVVAAVAATQQQLNTSLPSGQKRKIVSMHPQRQSMPRLQPIKGDAGTATNAQAEMERREMLIRKAISVAGQAKPIRAANTTNLVGTVMRSDSPKATATSTTQVVRNGAKGMVAVSVPNKMPTSAPPPLQIATSVIGGGGQQQQQQAVRNSVPTGSPARSGKTAVKTLNIQPKRDPNSTTPQVAVRVPVLSMTQGGAVDVSKRTSTGGSVRTQVLVAGSVGSGQVAGKPSPNVITVRPVVTAAANKGNPESSRVIVRQAVAKAGQVQGTGPGQKVGYVPVIGQR